MLSSSRSQKQNSFENRSNKLKSKSASPTLRKHSKEPSEEKGIQSSTSERESGKLGVQEIVSISCTQRKKEKEKLKFCRD